MHFSVRSLATPALAIFTIFLPGPSARATQPGLSPDYFPTCNAPQPIAPQQALAGSSTASRSNLVWTGQEFGLAYTDAGDSRLHFARIYADGTLAATPLTLTGRQAIQPPSLVWNGAGYGLAWVELNPAGTLFQIYFARLNPDGTMIGTELKVSVAGGTETAQAYFPALAWSGSGYAVVWQDYRNATTSIDIYATLLDATGAIAGGGLSHDLVVSNAANVQSNPAIAWSAGGGSYITVWQDYRSATKYELYGSRISNGAIGGNVLLVSGTSSSANPSLADTGNGLGMVWNDFRDGNNEIYFARLGVMGGKVGSDSRLTNDLSNSLFPRIAWTGAEFGIVWQDFRNVGSETWFQRVSPAGAPVGVNTQITYSGDTEYPDLAFGRYGYLVSGTYNPGPVTLQAWGCNGFVSTPGCPGNLIAYNITGTSATLGWLAADDFYYDIAYYKIYRNNLLVGTTSSTVFTDTGLGLSSSNSYAIRAVNAGQYASSTGCPTIFVKTNAFLTLKMNKATTTDAGLNWTNAGFNSYNLWRGTRPQVMTQIGQTPSLSSTDPNILPTPVSYFYSVDNPGP